LTAGRHVIGLREPRRLRLLIVVLVFGPTGVFGETERTA
jgi:hypothetical protein